MKVTLKKILIVVAIILVIYLGYVYYRKEKYAQYDALGNPALDKNYNMVDNWPVAGGGFSGYEGYDGVYGTASSEAWVKSHNPYDVTAYDYKNDYTDPIDLESDSRDCALGDNPYACGALKGGNSHYML